MTIVGVVGNIKTEGFDQPDQPHLYVCMFQNVGYAMAVYLKAEGDPKTLTQALRREVQTVDPNLPVFGEQTMEDVVSASLAQRRFALQVVGGFGVLALLLAGIGIYGVIAYSVSQREFEIALRLALGATPTAVAWQILREGLRTAMIGAAVGLGVALGTTRLLRAMFVEVSATDPVTLASVTLLLVLVAMAASWLPARWASSVDPLGAMN